MAAFNLEEAARQGRSGTIPPKWTRFSVSRGAAWSNLIIYSIGSLFILGSAIYLFITGALSSGPGQTTSPFLLLVLLVLGFLFLGVSLRVLPTLIRSDRHFFLITPDGFVSVAGSKLVGLPFTEISSASREPGLMGTKLVVRQRAGKALVLPIGRTYGARALREMEEALTAALKAPTQSKRQKRK
jgi:hypothetical protein